LQPKKKFKDEAGQALVNNYSIWGLISLSAAEKWLYICLQAHTPDLGGEIPDTNTPYIEISQRRLSSAVQVPYSTFRLYFRTLRDCDLVDVKKNAGKYKMQLLAPDPAEVQAAYQVKLNLVKSKQNKSFKDIGFTLVPKSLIYGYPELSPAAKYVYVIIKSLDWTGIGATWHRIRRLADMAGIKIRTFKKYLHDLQDAQLFYLTKKFGPRKATPVIFYNQTSSKEQKRACVFKACLNPGDLQNYTRKLDRQTENQIFEELWASLYPKTAPNVKVA
jgi:hypothetical protein